MDSNDHPNSPSPRVAELLTKAGWYPGRSVPTSPFIPDGFVSFRAAETVLREFGGLHFGECGAGVDFAGSDVEIDPRLADHLKAELAEHEQPLGARLLPLGEVHRGYGDLVIDERGRTYLLFDGLSPLASSFSQALESLLLGVGVDPGGPGERRRIDHA
jgi:SUKH-3 immunity protein